LGRMAWRRRSETAPAATSETAASPAKLTIPKASITDLLPRNIGSHSFGLEGRVRAGAAPLPGFCIHPRGTAWPFLPTELLHSLLYSSTWAFESLIAILCPSRGAIWPQLSTELAWNPGARGAGGGARVPGLSGTFWGGSWPPEWLCTIGSGFKWWAAHDKCCRADSGPAKWVQIGWSTACPAHEAHFRSAG